MSERGFYDPDEEFPWDCDLDSYTEQDVADLLDDGEDDGEEE